MIAGTDETRCQTTPTGVCPAPLGASLQATMATQVANGEVARQILYEFDFCRDEVMLSPRGRRQLAKIARRLPANMAPLVIQSTGDPELDRLRRERVIDELAALSFSVPQERVLTLGPSVRGLDGIDSTITEQKLQRLAPRPQPINSVGSSSFPPNNAQSGTGR
jgi:hypothetical protein